MKNLTEKFWLLTTALCLLATTSTFVVVVGNHQISEESSTELVNIEEVETSARRSERRGKRKHASLKLLQRSATSMVKFRANCSFFTPLNERDSLNGLGGYLLTSAISLDMNASRLRSELPFVHFLETQLVQLPFDTSDCYGRAGKICFS